MSEQLGKILIDNVDYSDRILWAKTHRTATMGIGTFDILLENQDGALNNGFQRDAEMKFDLAKELGQTMYPWFHGYVDDAESITVSEKYVQGRNMLEITGRDYGQDLQNNTTYTIDTAKLPIIVNNLLKYGTSIGLGGHGTVPDGYTEIGFDMPADLSGYPDVLCDSDGRNYINEVLTKILQLCNADAYVDRSKTYQLIYPAGSVDSYIVLDGTLEGGFIDDVRFHPLKGLDAKNVIIGLGASKIQDGWTDWGMSQFWQPGYPDGGSGTILVELYDWMPVVDPVSGTRTGNNLTCPGPNGTTLVLPANDFYTLDSGTPRAGAACLLVHNKKNPAHTNLRPLSWAMSFPRFYHWWLPFNWIPTGTIEWSMYTRSVSSQQPDGEINIGHPVFTKVGIELTDSLGNKILYMFGGRYNYNTWNHFSVPVGTEVTTEGKIYPSSWWQTWNWFSPWDKWIYTNGPVNNKPFNWKVVNMEFKSGEGGEISLAGLFVSDASVCTFMDYIIFDNLKIPGTQVAAVADHSGHGDAQGRCQICGRVFPQVKRKQYLLPLSGISHQLDMNNAVETVCNQRWNQTGTSFSPFKTFSAVVDGAKGLVTHDGQTYWNWFPGKSLSLNGSSNWRMIDIEETVERAVGDTGYLHTALVKGVPKTFQCNMDQFTYAMNNRLGIDRQIRNRIVALEAQGQIWNPGS